jgi:hypothetical protein
MSFNRLNFDSCAYKHRLNESIGPGEYMLDTNNFCEPCFVSAPGVVTQGYGAAICPQHLIDVDSELLGITRKASDCPGKHYLPSDTPYCGSILPKECNSLEPEPTKLSNPPCTLHCRGWNRWEWLCQNPQDRILIPFDTNINNRLIVKDNHRPCVPKPIDQSLALPPQVQHQKEMFCGTVGPLNPLNYRSCNELRQY